jgi:hypothetical protein
MLDDKEFLVMPKHPYVRSIRKRREVGVVVVVVAVLWHRPSEKVVPRLWGILFRASVLDAKTCGVSSLGLQFNAWYGFPQLLNTDFEREPSLAI